ncbi:MAG: cell envelope biogenesis protein TolA [Pseudomonadota bacterium]
MDRAEQTGLGVAIAGHVALFGALSLGLLSAPDLPKLDNEPVEVTLATEVDLQSAAPVPREAVPAQPQAEPELIEPAPAPIIAVSPPPLTEKSQPKPETKPVAKLEPAPKPKPKAETKPKPVKLATDDPDARRRPGLSKSIVSSLSDTPPQAKAGKVAAPSTAPSQPVGISVAAMTGAQKASLNSLIYSQLKPHWRPPSGADAELLITRLSVRLNKDGSLASDPEVFDQQGINDSNRTQAKLHAERAIQAVRRAAPFKLPPEYYEAWKWLRPLKLYVGQPG